MKKHFVKFLSVLLTVVIAFSSGIPVTAYEYTQSPIISLSSLITSGTCGENISWYLEVSEDGEQIKLNINGYGDMDINGCNPPWPTNVITDVIISGNITSICDYAFYLGMNIKNIVIADNNSLTRIGDFAFYGCKSLETLPSTPEALKSIGNNAFEGCLNIGQIYIQKNVESIGNNAFLNCPQLKNIDVDSDNQYYCSEEGVLFNKEMTSLIRYPAANDNYSYYIMPCSVTDISACAFEGNTSLYQIDISPLVTKINQGTFMNCTELFFVSFDLNISSIGPEALFNCPSLYSVYIKNSDCQIEDSARTITNNSNTSEPEHNVYIFGLRYSTAQEFAEKYGYVFKTLPATSPAPEEPTEPSVTEEPTEASEIMEEPTKPSVTTEPAIPGVDVPPEEVITTSISIKPAVTTSVSETVIIPKTTALTAIVPVTETSAINCVTVTTTTSLNDISSVRTFDDNGKEIILYQNNVIEYKDNHTEYLYGKNSFEVNIILNADADNVDIYDYLNISENVPLVTTTISFPAPIIIAAKIEFNTEKEMNTYFEKAYELYENHKITNAIKKISAKHVSCSYDKETDRVFIPEMTFEDDIKILSYIEVIRGDANGDEICNIRDAAYIAKSIALNKKHLVFDTADYNNDNIINIRDAAAIAKSLNDETQKFYMLKNSINNFISQNNLSAYAEIYLNPYSINYIFIVYENSDDKYAIEKFLEENNYDTNHIIFQHLENQPLKN